jgi:hypothetical protein
MGCLSLMLIHEISRVALRAPCLPLHTTLCQLFCPSTTQGHSHAVSHRV